MSVEVNSGAQVPETEFAKYVTASLVKDAYFQFSEKATALVRRDFGATSVAYIMEMRDITEDILQKILGQFVDQGAQHPHKQAISYTFLFISSCWEEKQECARILVATQEEMDRAGVLADLVLVDCSACAYHTGDGRSISDRKLRKVLDAVLCTWKLPAESRKEAQQETMQAVRQRRRDMAPQIERKGPNPIWMLLIANVLIFIGGWILKWRTGTDWFIEWGIQDNNLILQGEVWRLLTSMFLHADLAHLGGNMLFLYLLGKTLRLYYSYGQLWLIYLGAGLVGNVAGFFFTNYLSLGASGAIMGLGGALVFRMFWGKHAVAFRHAGNFVSLATMILYNLLYGIFTPGIDNYGHFGGFIGGMLLAAIVAAISAGKETHRL